MKKFGWLLLFAAMTVGNVATAALAQSTSEDTSDVIDLGTLTCRDFLKSEGEDRTNLMIFMHGYMSGQEGDLTIDGLALAEASDSIIEACIDDPDETLANTFAEYR